MKPKKPTLDFIKKIKKNTNDIIYGTFFIAFLEFIISLIVFWLFGIKSYFILAIAVGILAFIPAIGPVFVWAPLSVIKFVYGEPFVALGVLLLGFFLSGVIDSLLRAKVLNELNSIMAETEYSYFRFPVFLFSSF